MSVAKPTTLREVARQAGVSVATVSFVLNGKGRMSPERRRTIEAMLRDAGIRPRYVRYPVLYISDYRDFADMHAFEYLFRIHEGMSASLNDASVDVRLEFLHRSNSGPLHTQLERLLALRPGAVALSLVQDLQRIANFFEQNQVPVLQVGHTVRAEGINAVVVDSFGGAYLGVKHLIGRGHRRIATIRWNVKGDPASSKKFAAYTCALGEAGIPVRNEYIVESPFTKQGTRLPGRAAAEQLLALPEPPTAVFVENSFISSSLVHIASAGEREIPKAIRDLDIVHFEAESLDWMEQVLAGKLAFPDRHTKLLRINWEEMGRMAGKRLLARIEGAEPAGQVFQLVPRLFEVKGNQFTAL